MTKADNLDDVVNRCIDRAAVVDSYKSESVCIRLAASFDIAFPITCFVRKPLRSVNVCNQRARLRQSLDHRILLIRWQMDVSGHFCKRRIVFGAVLASEKALVGGKVRLIRIGPLLRNSAIIDYGLNGERGRGAPAAASSTTRVGVGGTVQDELLRQNGQVTRCQRPIALNRFRATESPAATYKGGEIEIQHVILEGRARIESKGHLSLPRQEVSASYGTKISLPHLPWSFTVLITP